MLRRVWIRIAVTLHQNRLALLFVGVWLLFNWAVFFLVFGRAFEDALLLAICLRTSEGPWGRFYTGFTEVVVFGAVATMVVSNATRRYKPESTCAALAERASGHLLVIGYTNLGKRVSLMGLEAGADVVVVEENRALVEELIRSEQALVLGNAREAEILEAARVELAKVVVIATEDLETAAVACRLVREKNKGCKLVVRCPDDDIGQVLAKAYNARALSTSKAATRYILGRVQKSGARRAVVLGKNNLGKRVAEALLNDGIETELIAETQDVVLMQQAGVAKADLVVIADDDLGQNLIRVDRVRDLNPNCAIVCRVFHDDSAEILKQKPFSCLVLSTSRLSADMLADEGVFTGIGLKDSGRAKKKKSAA